MLMLIGQVVFIIGPTDSAALLVGTALLRGIGFLFPMGLVNAMTGDTIEYGEWKTGTKVQAVLFSAKSVAEKLGQGLMTSLFGFFLTAVGYDGNLAAQPASAVSGIEYFFKFAPLAVIAAILLICMRWKLDDEMPQIQKDLEARREKAAPAGHI
jgi:GPH family glycoside/pentoside/hexuronide:cation symporter